MGISNKMWYNFTEGARKMAKVYRKLKNKRIRHGMSCKDMAKKLGISPTYYSQIENKRRRLYYFMAVKMADIFKITPDELFYDD